MLVSVAQINPTIADLSGNVALCLQAAKAGRLAGADLVVLPEMAIPGYPPRDLLYDPSFIDAIEMAHQDLAIRSADGPPLLIGSVIRGGSPAPNHPGLLNVALLFEKGEIRTVAEKQLLPIYDVFLEPRWFVPGRPGVPFEISGARIGVMICEDMWDEGYAQDPGQALSRQGAELLIVLSASPFRQGIFEKRFYHARRQPLPLLYVNLVGCSDELIFDGGSFLLDGDGSLRAQLPRFETSQQEVNPFQKGASDIDAGDDIGMLYKALVAGIRDFAAKNRMRHLVLGLSGGIDSAVVAALAAEAIGPEQVTGVAIPSRFTNPCSTESASLLAQRLGIGFEIVSLEPLHAAAVHMLGSSAEAGTASENVQVRLRMLILMGIVNNRGGMLLNTSNKTELALGYATLYGDMAGGLSPLGDVIKPEVYALAHYINR
ncbi:MAG: NAD(+) synthase, partial [Chloroflexota bacterium]